MDPIDRPCPECGAQPNPKDRWPGWLQPGERSNPDHYSKAPNARCPACILNSNLKVVN